MSGKWEPAKGSKGVTFARNLSTEKIDRMSVRRSADLSGSSESIESGSPTANTLSPPGQSAHLHLLTQKIHEELLLKSPTPPPRLSSSSSEYISTPTFQPLSTLPPPVIQVNNLSNSQKLELTQSNPSTPTSSQTISLPPTPPPRPHTPKSFQEQFCNVELERTRENLIISKVLHI